MEIPFFLLQSNIACIYAVVVFNFRSCEFLGTLKWWWFLFASLSSDCAFSYDPSLPICFLNYQQKLVEIFNVNSRTDKAVTKACWDVSLLWSDTFQQKYLLAWGGCWWEKIWGDWKASQFFKCVVPKESRKAQVVHKLNNSMVLSVFAERIMPTSFLCPNLCRE